MAAGAGGESAAEGEADAPVGMGDLHLNVDDPDPTAGASDIGGLPGGSNDLDRRDEDRRATGEGQMGTGTGPGHR
ncbi:MAG: hypothetical protein NVS3B7_20740 [Candidatus Elarobacter sp.]